MLKLIKYYPVNWIDGMKLTREHLLANNHALADAVRDAANAGLNSYNFGLLPPVQGMESALDLTIDVDRAGLIRATLKNCRAITPAGARIEIINIAGQKFHASIGQLKTEYNIPQNSAKALFVVLSVNPFDRAPFGEPSPDEQPPRYPFSIPGYSLDVIPQEQFTEIGPFHLPLAKLLPDGQTARVVEQYIPPSTSMESHAELLRFFNETDVFLSTLELHTGAILQKIYQKKQSNPLAEMATYVGERMMTWFSHELAEFRWTCAERPPVYTFSAYAALARVIKNALEMRTGSGREEFINYLTDWDEFGLQQGEFEALLNDMVVLVYNHLDIADSLAKSRRLNAKLLQVFTKLAKLDYIGKKEDPGIIVAQRSAAEAEKKSTGNKGSSIWLE